MDQRMKPNAKKRIHDQRDDGIQQELDDFRVHIENDADGCQNRYGTNQNDNDDKVYPALDTEHILPVDVPGFWIFFHMHSLLVVLLRYVRDRKLAQRAFPYGVFHFNAAFRTISHVAPP